MLVIVAYQELVSTDLICRVNLKKEGRGGWSREAPGSMNSP